MKTIFFDCKNGISGDMVLKALMDLSGRREAIEEALKHEHLHTHDDHVHHDHSHSGDHDHHHAHGRSWLKVRELIDHSSFSDEAKQTAISIYQNIAEAEASVHGETLETIHFHEVGRDEAIKNALGIGMALEAIKNSGQGVQAADEQLEILTSPICDGKGTIVCSHGEIPVPVPAVMALRAKCTYAFETADVNMEMVTPSGLASLMGIKAKPAVKTLQQLLAEQDDSGSPRVKLVAETEAKGSRDTGRGGLRVYLLENGTSDNIPSDRREQ
ncbi:MAG: DUF111 family protein [Bacillota bacterium]|nr:DUF111 family protein [Bacillota bacterium]